jgi:hypothetical protein
MLNVSFREVGGSKSSLKPRFLDRKIANVLDPKVRRFLMRAGGAVRLTARRSLKLSRITRYEEQSQAQREQFGRAVARWRAGERTRKPTMPRATSQPGHPPLIHSKLSPLKQLLYFALSNDKRSVVVGPEAIGKNRRVARVPNQLTSIQELEQSRPFMEPAFDRIEPKFATFWPKG